MQKTWTDIGDKLKGTATDSSFRLFRERITDNISIRVACYNNNISLRIFKSVHNRESAVFFDIIMDVMMPVMNGYDATRKIRSMNRPDAKTIPIIAMTANAFVEDIQESKEAGMTEHISKPLDIDKVVATILNRY